MKNFTSSLFTGKQLFAKGMSVFCALVFLVAGINNAGAQILWSSSAGSAWATGSNWTGSAVPGTNGVPPTSTSAIAQFSVNPTSAATGVGLNMASVDYGIGAIEITSARSNGLLFGNSTTSANGNLYFYGATVNSVANTIIRSNATGGTVTFQNIQGSGNKTMTLLLSNATDNIVQIDGVGGITISSVIGQNASGYKLTKGGTGTGILELQGANTYTGLTTVSGGTLLLNRTGGTTIPSTNSITVNNGATCRISTAQTLANVTVDPGGTLIVDATLTITGTATINGSFQLNTNGYATGGTWTYGAASTLAYNSATQYGTGAHSYWPATNSPFNVTLLAAAGAQMQTVLGARTIAGTLTLNGVLDVQTAGNLTVTGTVKINSGGSITSNAPKYGSSSLLQYNSGTNPYVRGLEWSATGAGTIGTTVGYPNNVQVSNNTTINFPNGSNTARACNGDFTIDAGSSLYADYSSGSVDITVGGNVLLAGNLSLGSASGGDFHFKGNWTHTTGTFASNGRAVELTGAGTQTITKSGGETFAILTINKASGSAVLANDVTVSGTLNLTAGLIDIAASNLTPVAISGGSATTYVKTTGAGQLKQVVTTSAKLFPVGNAAYNPITLTNTGTSATYGIIETDGAVPSALDATKAVNRRWIVTASASGGSLAVVNQFNTGEGGAGYTTGTGQFIGLYNSSAWSQQAATLAGSNPYTVTSNTNFGNTLPASGTASYFAVGNSGAFLTPPTPPTITSFSVAAPGSGTSGYVGTVITVTGTNFLATGMVVKVGATTISSYTFNSSTSISFTAINLGGTISIDNGTAPVATSGTAYTNLGYITQTTGSYVTGSTWLGGSAPYSSDPATVAHNPVTIPGGVTTVGTVTITSSGYLSSTAGGSLNGTTLINNGTYEQSGTITNATFTNITNAGTLLFTVANTITLSSGGTFTNNTGGTISGSSGTIIFAGTATINGTATAPFINLTLNGATTIITAPTISTLLLMNSTSASVSAGINYGGSSTLRYATGAPMIRGYEWSASSGAGYPNNVDIASSTAIDAGGTSFTGTALNLAGNLTIGTGSGLYMDYSSHNMTVPLTIGGNLTLTGTGALSGSATGGNVVIKGNWINNGTASNYFPNSQSVTFSGTSAQTVGGTSTTANPFYNVIINNSTGVSLGSSQAISNSLTLTSGLFTLGNYNLTMSSGAAISGYTSAKYVQTSNTGRLIQTVSSTDVFYPVGKSAYNPVTLNNSGTLDTYGVYVVDATTSPAANNQNLLVNRYWNVNEGTGGGNNLYVKVQYNSGEEFNAVTFALGITPRIGVNTGTWAVQGATTAGLNPYTYATTSNITTNITSGATIGAGKDNAFIGVAPTVSSFIPTSGYVGTAVVITGTDFTGVTGVSFGGTPAESYTVLTTTSISAVIGFGTTGAVCVTTASGSGCSGTNFTYLPGYITVQDGDYNTATTWLNGAVPPANQTVIIANTVTISATPANTVNQLNINTVGTGGSLEFNNAAATLTAGGVTNNGTLSFTAAGTLNVSAASTFTNNGTFTRGTGTVNFAGAGTINGSAATTFNNLTINAGGLTLTTVPTIDGILRINGGNVNQAPKYSSNSTLYYNVGYGRYLEWSATGVGTPGTTPGYPNNVTINTGTFDGAANVGTYGALAMNGLLTINNGGTFNLNAINAAVNVGNGITVNTGGTFSQGSSNTAVNITGNVNVAGTYTMSTSTGGATITGNLTNSGGTITMSGATGNLTVTGAVNNSSGSLTLSSSFNSDLYVGGNISNGGTFTHNTRAVNMNGTSGQTISGTFNNTNSATNCFAYLVINNSNNVTLGANVGLNSSLALTNGKLILSTYDLTISNSGFGGSITNANASRYVQTNSSGQLKQTVSSVNIDYPVGNSAYNPITLNNTGGTSDIYGVNVLDGVIPATINDATYAVNRRWQVTEATSGGSNLAVTAQYNTGEQNTNYNSGTTDYLGFYNGSSWVEKAATRTGSNPYTVASNSNFAPSNLTTGTQYFAIGRDDAFLIAPPVITGFTGNVAGGTGIYTGETITITGSNLASATAISFNGVAGTIIGTPTATSLQAQMLNGTSASGNISVTAPGGTATTAFTFLGYRSANNGDYATASTWIGSILPSTSSRAVTIANAVTLTTNVSSVQTGAVTVLASNSLTFGASGYIKVVSGSIFTNNGTVDMTSGGTLEIVNGTLTNNSTFTAGTGLVFFSGGVCTIAGTNAVTFYDVTNAASLGITTIPTINHNLTLTTGSVSTASAINYGTSSTLVYASSGNFNTGNEWRSGATTGVAVPYNVAAIASSSNSPIINPNGNILTCRGNLTLTGYDATHLGSFGMNNNSVAFTVQGDIIVNAYGQFKYTNVCTSSPATVNGNITIAVNGIFNITNASTSSPTTAGGNITNGGALTLGSAVGGDLYVGGNFTNNGTFTHNSRAVFFTGTAQTVSGSFNTTGATNGFAYVRINNGTNVTLAANANVDNNITFNSGKITLSTFNLTLKTGTTITTPTSANYIVTNSTGQLKQIVTTSAITFPVGNSAYNPITLTNSGTSDTYGINVVDGTVTSAIDPTKAVNRRWYITELVAGGSNLTPIVLQYNGGEEGTNYNAGTTPKMGLYNGTSWTSTNAVIAGSNPYTATATGSGQFSATIATGSYLAIGKDNVFGTSANDYFRSITTGNWSSTSTWESSPDNVTWYAATIVPGSAANSGFVTVRNGHTVTVDYLAKPSTITIASGGTVVGSDDTKQLLVGSGGYGALNVSGTLTLNSGLVTNGWLICGTLTVGNGGIFNNNCGNAIAAGSTNVTSLVVQNGGTYNHNAVGSSANGSTSDFPGGSGNAFGATSNTNVTKWAQISGTSPVPLPANTYGNLTINVTALGGSWNQAGSITNIQGDLNIQATGGGSNEFRFVGNTTLTTLSIGGNVNISGGVLKWTQGSTSPTVNITKGFNITGGTYTADNIASSSVNFIAGGSGDIDVSGGTNTFGTTTIASGRICNVLNTSNINVASGKTFAVSGATNIAPGAVISGSGTFSLTNAATSTLGIGSTAGITSSGATGNVQTTTRTFNNGANYVYTGTASQAGGTGLPATVYTLTIANTGTSGNNIVTLSQSVGVTAGTAPSLGLSSGLLNVGGSNVNISDNGGITATSGNFDPAGTTGSITLLGTATISGTIDFYPSVYQTPSSAKGVTYSTGITMHNVLRLDMNSFVNGNSPTYTTNSTLLYNAGGSYSRNVEWSTNTSGPGYPYDVTIRNGTTVDLSTNGGGAHSLANDLALGFTGSAGNLTLNNSGSTLTVNGNLTIGSNTGTSTLTLSTASGGDIKVGGNWTRTANGAFTPNGRAVFFNGATPTTITHTGGETFDYLFVNKNSGTATTLANNITVNNNLNLASVITTNVNKVIIPTQTGVTAAGGWVAGNLQKAVSTTGAADFEIGGPTNYRPVNLIFNTIGTAGNLTAFVTQSSGVYSPLTGSGFDASTVLTRNYKLTSSGLAGNYDAVFNFVAGDVPGGANTATYVVRNTTNSGTTWNQPIVGTRTATSTQATGLTTFGDFVIGNKTTLVVTTQPADQAICAGGNTTFTSAATTVPLTAGTITVQWEVSTDGGATFTSITNGGVYSGVTTGTLTITGATAGMDTYKYHAVFTDVNGSVTSNSALLTVNAKPTVSITGSSSTCPGVATLLTANATAGSGTITSYQWKLNGIDITGANSSTYSTSTAGNYTVVVTNSNTCSTTSAIFALALYAAPAKPTISGPMTACSPSTITLTSSHSGGNVWSPGGATTDQITISATGSQSYTVYYTDGNGCVSPTSDPYNTQIFVQPLVTITPSGPLEFCAGGSVDLTSSQTSGNVWSTGSTGQTITATTSGTYTVVYTNGNGCSASSAVVVKVDAIVTPSVTISANPSLSICSGTSITFTATPTNGGVTPTYQWYVNNIAQAGATASTFTATLSNNDVVKVELTSSEPCTTINPATGTVTINAANTWTGSVSTNWSTPGNWSCNQVPAATDDAVIPQVSNQPSLSGATTIKNINLQTGAILNLNGQTFTLNGAVSGAGTLSGSLTSNMNVNGTGTIKFTTGSNTLNDLTINTSGTVTLGTALNVAGVFTPATGTFSLGSNNLTLKAGTDGNYPNTKTFPATGTVGVVGATLDYSGGGKFVVERYIPAKRSFRFIASSVNTSGNLRANWMEGAYNAGPGYGTNNNPNPGYGTHISGSATPGDNLDWTYTNNPSLFTYNNAAQTWNAVYNSNGTLAAGFPYRLLVRGNRGIDLSQNDPPGTATILRETGALLTGDVTLGSVTSTPASMPLISGNTNDFSYVGNPYAASVSWLKIYGTSTGISPTYTAYDPNINARGAYVAYNAATGLNQYGNFTTSKVDSIIQPGQAFFVQTSAANPVLNFKEQFKKTAFTTVWRTVSTMPKLTLTLVSGATNKVLDGNVAIFDSQFNMSLGNEDSYKFTNLDENMSIMSNSKLLSIEGRPEAQVNDSIPLKIWQYKQSSYLLDVNAENFDPLLTAVVKDKYLNIEIPINLGGDNQVPFTITSDIASSAPDRFVILFKTGSTLPLTNTKIKAYQKEKGIQVEWSAQNEINTDHYEVEKSTDGRRFVSIADVNARRNNSVTEYYDWFDANPLTGSNLYRIKIISKTGAISYTQVAEVKIGRIDASVTVFPNPVQGRILNVRMAHLDKGRYSVILYNVSGEKVFSKVIEHNGAESENYSINVGQVISKGTYRMTLISENAEISQSVVFE